MYTGQSYRIPQIKGWNNNPDQDSVPKEAMADCENINIHRGGRQPRGGCEKVGDLAGTPEITGIYHFIRENGDISGFDIVDEGSDNIGDEDGNIFVSEGSFIMCTTGDGQITSGYTTVLKTGLTSNVRQYFETFYDELYISNGEDVPQIFKNNLDYTHDMGSPIACTATIAAGAGVTAGTHSYKITFTTSEGESSGGTKSNVVTTAGGNLQVELTAIEVGPTGTTSRKIYRTIAGDTGSHLLVDTIADNTTTTYTDNTADGGLGAASPSTSLAFLPTDWQSNWPKYFIKHGRGVHKRLIAFGCYSYPNRLYMSANGQADFNDTDVILIRILTEKITGGVNFAGNFICFSRDKTYVLDDVALSTANWGYETAAWDGGAAHQKLIVQTPNDIAVMSEDGNIFSIKASQQYGDYEIGSITKPFHIDKWIRDEIDLLQIDKFHGIFDPELRAIKWFMVKKNSNYCDVCLVYFIDYAEWTRHEFTNVSDTLLPQICSGLVKINVSEWRIYTGDDAGLVFELESPILKDNDVNYEKSFTTPALSLDNPRVSKLFDRVWAVVKPQGTEILIVELLVDGRSIKTMAAEMTGSNSVLQNILSYLGTSGIRVEVKVSSADDEDFFVNEIMVDYEILGAADEFAVTQFITGAPNEGKGYLFPVSEEYDAWKNTWISKNQPTVTGLLAKNLASSTILGKGYIFGGSGGAIGLTLLDRCQEYTVSLDSWSIRTDLLFARYGLAGSTISDKGYIYGGATTLISGSELRDCDEFNSLLNSWAAKTNIPTPARLGLAASTLLNKGYIYAGNDDVGVDVELQDCDEYDPSVDTWDSKTAMPTPARYLLAASTISDLGYVYGGVDDSAATIRDCDSYNSVSDIWTNRMEMPLPVRYYSAATTIGEKGYVMGGINAIGGDLLADNDEYDPLTNRWINKTNLLDERSGYAATTI